MEIGSGEAPDDSRSWIRREAAEASAALQSTTEPIAAARGGAGAPADDRRVPFQHSWSGRLRDLVAGRGELQLQLQCAPSPAASLEQLRYPLCASPTSDTKVLPPPSRLVCCLLLGSVLIRVGGKFIGKSEL